MNKRNIVSNVIFIFIVVFLIVGVVGSTLTEKKLREELRTVKKNCSDTELKTAKIMKTMQETHWQLETSKHFLMKQLIDCESAYEEEYGKKYIEKAIEIKDNKK